MIDLSRSAKVDIPSGAVLGAALVQYQWYTKPFIENQSEFSQMKIRCSAVVSQISLSQSHRWTHRVWMAIDVEYPLILGCHLGGRGKPCGSAGSHVSSHGASKPNYAALNPPKHQLGTFCDPACCCCCQKMFVGRVYWRCSLSLLLFVLVGGC